MCAWWNPADWAKDAGKKVGEGVMDAIAGLGTKIRENPQIIAIPAAAITGSIVVWHGARTYGERLGQDLHLEPIINEIIDEVMQ